MARYEYGGRNTRTYQKLHGFKKLVAWQKASDLGCLINRAVGEFGPGHYRLVEKNPPRTYSVTARSSGSTAPTFQLTSQKILPAPLVRVQ